MIIHLPHASTEIPAGFRGQFLLSDRELEAELLAMTDRFTDELFAWPGATMLRVPYSRLLVDVERFANDEAEPMAKQGMGRFYMRTSQGRPLRRMLSAEETTELSSLYDRHHQELSGAVADDLKEYGAAMIVDAHSFPDAPLPCDRDQSRPRPDFCLGVDDVHTPESLWQGLKDLLRHQGYTVGINQPYAGSIVPLEHLNQATQVASIMIEVNRRLYMDEKTGRKEARFASVRQDIESLLRAIEEAEHRARKPKPGIWQPLQPSPS